MRRLIEGGAYSSKYGIVSAETCFLTFSGRDLPLMGLKTPHNREPIPMVTISSIFAFLELKVIHLSFDFLGKHFVKADTTSKKKLLIVVVLEKIVVFSKRLLSALEKIVVFQKRT